MIAQAKKYF